ncbi:BLOC-1-related complex subunit 8-like isoform X3 [Crassostrea angulata]|uniref:BLOC-1-related complex subunit 8-like isoform X3 n=1 Tax=Magallana angulata TaxID=2784310 RepID=UPI0005C35E20|nr:BLOC-1-related complex subunit 8 isoform X3 [Crassostrea gigas]XP_052698385.1 BLOC-1-related complex subunit 8-like isoform X3 [Crassostrea angulata]|eukprot:XP_011432792.1 PREDICTED: BLOC-1-related complex subunit 8-like isoform X2 [Crassostrea gigas]
MDSGISYSYPTERRMQGGDIRYNMMTTSSLFREAQDEEMELKVKKVAERLSESMNIVANEPSLAFFRIQEHVRKSLPQLVEQKHEVIETQQKVQGASFDTEYATHAVKSLHKSSVHFQNIQELMKNAMFMKQQIDYEEDRKLQKKAQSTKHKTARDDIEVSVSRNVKEMATSKSDNQFLQV